MLLNDVDNPWVELVFYGEVDPILDVGDDNQRAHRRRKRIVRILCITMLIFDEITWFFQFSDIVKVGTNSAHWSVGTYFFSCSFCESSDH